LAGETPFAEEAARAEHRHDGLSAGLRQDRELDAPGLDVHDVLADVSLAEDRVASPVLHHRLRETGRVEKRLRVERATRRSAVGRFSTFHVRSPAMSLLPN